MWRPEEDSTEDTGYSIEELKAMIAVFKAESAKFGSNELSSPVSSTPRRRPTKESLEATGMRVLPSSGTGYILPMGPPKR